MQTFRIYVAGTWKMVNVLHDFPSVAVKVVTLHEPQSILGTDDLIERQP